MLLSKLESTEDAVVRVLAHAGKEMKELHQTLLKESHKITLQALYRSVNTLVENGVILKSGLIYIVNKEWLHGVINYFDRDFMPLLSEGESASYSFKSLSALDSYWKHTIVQLHGLLGDYPIFFYNTHVIWLHLEDRKESQKNYLDSFDLEKKHAYFIVGGNRPVDQEFKQRYSRDYLRVELRKVETIKNDSLTVHNDFIISVKFKKKTTELIDKLYAECKTMREIEEALEHSIKQKISVQLTIEKNAKKAEKLRKVLAKNFYIPREVREEFKLSI